MVLTDEDGMILKDKAGIITGAANPEQVKTWARKTISMKLGILQARRISSMTECCGKPETTDARAR